VQTGIWKRIKAEIAIWHVGLLPGITIIGLVTIARLTSLLQSLEWTTLDNFLRLRPGEPIDERIVIIGINEADIRSVKAYPIPDREIAALLRKLQTYEPRVIGLDLIRDLPVQPGHTELVTAFKDIKNLIAIEKVLPAQINPPSGLPPTQIGFSDAIPDTDGRLRRSLIGTPTFQGYKFSLSLRLAEAFLSHENITLENGIRDRHAMRFGNTELPRFLPNSGGYVGADAGGLQVLINFRSGRERFRTLSLNDIKTGKFNPNWLRDRVVIIGIASPSVDIVNTSAITSTTHVPGIAYGVEIHAHAVSQIISAVLAQRPLLQVWSDGWEYLWICGWGFLGIALARFISSPLKSLLGVGIGSIGLIGVSYTLLIVGWWIPVVPAFLVFTLTSVGLTAFYQYDRALRSRINDRQLIIERTFDTIHNGPLQTLATILRRVQDQEFPQNQLLLELENLNHELRAVNESLRRETITHEHSLYLSSSLEIDLEAPMHEVLYAVYNSTLERDFPCFKTLKFKIHTFDPVEDRRLSIDQKRGLCRFLEEALCNIGKHATGVTRISVTYTQKEGWYILRVTDNGLGISSSSEGRGTQQSKNLARELKGKFQRSPLSAQGTLCELTWPGAKR